MIGQRNDNSRLLYYYKQHGPRLRQNRLACYNRECSLIQTASIVTTAYSNPLIHARLKSKQAIIKFIILDNISHVI